MNQSAFETGTLAGRIARGDREAEVHLVLRFRSRVLGALRRQLRDDSAEDLCQETLGAALVALRAGRLRQVDRLEAYLRGIASNLARRERRRRWREVSPGEGVPEVPDREPGPEQRLIDEERKRRVRHALGGLADRDRVVLHESLLIENDKPAICARLGLTPAQFDVVKHRALRRLARALGAEPERRPQPLPA